MKRTICLLLTFVLLLGMLFGCKKLPADPEASATFTTDSISAPTNPPANETAPQQHYFRFLNSDSIGTCVLMVYDSPTNRIHQIIRLGDHEYFSESPYYWMDISFDGKKDIVVPYYRTAGKLYYKGYVWDDAIGMYIHAPGFENIPNFALHGEKEAILSYTVADSVTAYSMYSFHEASRNFVCDRTVYWNPAEESGYLNVTELLYTDGVPKQVCRFNAASSDGYMEIDCTDPNMIPYFQEDSLWSLGNSRWEHPLTLAQAPIAPPSEPSFQLPTSNNRKNYFKYKGYAPPNMVGMIRYLFHEPIWDTGKDYPLIIFLHGLGDDVNTPNFGTAGPLIDQLIALENQEEFFSAYTLVPVTPGSNEGWWTSWQLDFLKNLIYQLVEDYNIDPKRIYLTGISMGGYTTCDLVNQMPPNTFAAAVPLSGARQLQNPTDLYNTAFRIYHCKDDTVVAVSCSRSLDYQLRQAEHPNAEYIEFPDGGHISPLYKVYYDISFYHWLFAQQLP